MDRRELGYFGEKTAADLLTAKGYKILETNYRSVYGEIDIICEKPVKDRMPELVFVEVKTRQTINFGVPAEAVDRNKRSHIRRTALFYMKEKRKQGRSFSFHVIEIYLNHIENAF